MKCPKCKKELRKNAKFCTACGARVEKKRGIRFTSVLLVISILLGIIVIGCGGGILFAKFFGGKFENLFSGKNSVEIHNVEDAIAQAKVFGEEYGYENATSELTEKVTTNVEGDRYYRLQQNYQGIPVYGRNIIYATNEKGIVTSFTGNACDVSSDLNITPTITYAQAVDAANEYFYSNYGIEDICRNGSVSADEGSLCIYNMKGESLLAYSVFAGGYEILVDAHNADVISISQRMNYNSVNTSSSNSATNYAWKTEDGTYILRDSERNIYIYNAGEKTYWDINPNTYDPSVLSLVTSQDAAFGNNESATAVSFLQALTSVYDYYKVKLYNETGYGVIAGIYNDALGQYKGENAGGGILDVKSYLPSTPPGYDWKAYNGKIGGIIMGSKYSNDFLAATDLLGHEYTHFVTAKYVNWVYSYVVDERTGVLTETDSENGAINEGLSDIFGELIELHIRGNTDWTLGSRTIYDPSINGYPEKYGKAERDGKGWIPVGKSATDYSHAYNTIISRAAYLMWNGIDGDDAKKISPDTLAKLWYRTMLMMPSDCKFIECRHLVEFAAKSMGSLKDSQIACVSEAFDEVGIYSDDPIETELTYMLKPDSKLSVIGKDGQEYSGYSLDVQGLEDTLLWHEDANGKRTVYWGGAEYNRSFEVDEVPATLDLPFGYYIFTITDKYNPESTYSFTASIRASGLDDEIVLYTDYEKPLIVKVTEPSTSNESSSRGIAIAPGTYAQEGADYNTLTIHEVNRQALKFTAFWYRIGDISNASAVLDGSTASFDYTSPTGNWRIVGTLQSPSENTVVLTILDSTFEYIDVGEYRYSLIDRKVSDSEPFSLLPRRYDEYGSGHSVDAGINLEPDGNFTCTQTFLDWGDNGDNYPNGTCYISEFQGKFTDLTQIDELTYQMSLEYVQQVGRVGDEYIENSIRYIVERNTRLEEARECYIFLPGTKYEFDGSGGVSTNGKEFWVGAFYGNIKEILSKECVFYIDTMPVFISGAPDTETAGHADQNNSGDNILESSLGFIKAWDIHENYNGEHIVTTYAFRENGTYYSTQGFYLSELFGLTSGTYEIKGNEVSISFEENGESKTISYEINGQEMTFTQASDTGLYPNHTRGDVFKLKENPEEDALDIKKKVDTYG